MAEGLSELWDGFHLTEEENIEVAVDQAVIAETIDEGKACLIEVPRSKGVKFDGPVISETRTGRDGDKEKSVNAPPNIGQEKIGMPNLKKAIVLVKQRKDNLQDIQDENSGMLGGSQPNLLQQGEGSRMRQREGSKNRDSNGVSMDAEYNKMGSEEVKSKTNNEVEQSVDMDVGQNNNKGEGFVFTAINGASSGGVRNRDGKKWKREARVATSEDGNRKDTAAKLSGRKREGSKGVMEVRKKSREDGELASDSISEYNSPAMAERKGNEQAKKFKGKFPSNDGGTKNFKKD
ncbi:hypothetical protein COLO4_23478 [Corchorus olitorius]|uniref:Uncharacterized protein n=1 Tax=Corchorus olitorius TaxID=93759 RepID=A0A1R3IGD3_9ROSI|nr:hypothetical protein COLO4_23478 [Corchorus olitorius]